MKSTWCKRVCNNVSGVRWQASNFSVDLLVVQSDLRHTYFRVFSSTLSSLDLHSNTCGDEHSSHPRYCLLLPISRRRDVFARFHSFCVPWFLQRITFSGYFWTATRFQILGARFLLTFTCIFPDDVNTALPRVLTFRIIEVFVVTPQNFGSLADLGREDLQRDQTFTCSV